MRKSLSVALGSFTSLALLVTPAVSSAHQKPSPTPPEPEVISSELAAPFNLDLNGRQVYFADGGLNLVGRVRADGSVAPVAANQPGASGIAHKGGWLAFTTTQGDQNGITASGLNLWGPRGKRVHADTLAFEKRRNPDQVNRYGPRSADPCVVGALGPRYKGAVDSHAYSVAAYGTGWIVADAGANALLKVDRRGRVSTLSVLPPQPLRITADLLAAYNASLPPGAPQLPSCVVGVTVDFEPVPTDVEVGRDGSLYVTTLPGGAEGPELGARGKVWKVNPWSGRARVLASGFAGATNLALGRSGEIYVSELFGGGISVVKKGKKAGFIPLPGAVAVESNASGALYAATLGDEEAQTPGTIVRLAKGKVSWKAKIKR